MKTLGQRRMEPELKESRRIWSRVTGREARDAHTETQELTPEGLWTFF